MRRSVVIVLVLLSTRQRRLVPQSEQDKIKNV